MKYVDPDPAKWDDETVEAWTERAAIKQFCGGMTRTQAELEAMREITGRDAKGEKA